MGYQVPGIFFAKNDEKPYSNKTTIKINPSKLKYLQKFKGEGWRAKIS